VKLLRVVLCEDAYARGLMSVLAPVERRKSALKSVLEKHMEDVWELVCTIRERREVPRVLLKGGKRSKQEWCRTQERVAASSSSSGEPNSQLVSDMLDRYIKAGGDESLSMREAGGEVVPARRAGLMNRHGALQASAVRDVNGLAASSGDRCGAVQVLDVDGLAVSSGDWCGALATSYTCERCEYFERQCGWSVEGYPADEVDAFWLGSWVLKSDTCCKYMLLSSRANVSIGKSYLESISSA